MDGLDFSKASTLVDHLCSQAASDPRRTIFKFADQYSHSTALSYTDIDAAARRLAAHLQALGMTGERAVLMHAPGPEYVLALIGCFYAGVVAVPAYPPRFNRPMERLRDLVIDADARLALTTDAALKRMQGHLDGDEVLSKLIWLATDALPVAVSADDWRQPDIRPDSLALLQYTSGSTSAPKGVMITHACFRNNVLSMAQALKATRDDRMVTWLPPYHDMGLVGGLLGSLFLGIETVVLSPSAFMQRPLRWLTAIDEHRATISGGPNFAYELCVRRVTQAQREQLDLRSWRVAFCGAERVRAATLQKFSQNFAISGFRNESFAPCYGLAEATLGVSFSTGALHYADAETHQPISNVAMATNAEQRALVSCGAVIPDVQARIVDPQTLQPLTDGEVGELWLQSNAMAAGYWHKPELSIETFQAHLIGDDTTAYLRTGDLGFMQQGALHVLGRLKDLIIIRGVNVFPEDIEALVEHVHEDLRPAGAVAFSIDRDDIEQVVVVQELNVGVHDMDFDEVSKQIRRVIADVMQVAVQQVVLVAPGAVPRTSSGKVQRRRCRELYLAGQLETVHASGAQSSVLSAANPELINQVAQLMADLLGVDVVTADDDFFWLGGHSLMATQLASRVRTAFAVELPLSVIFSASTPRQLAAHIAQLPASAIRPDIRPAPRGGRLPMTFSQERMWLLHQMDPSGTAYNVAGAVLISGPLEVSALSRAFTAVVAAHEIMRTRYRTIDGEADVQVVEPETIELVAIDLRAHAHAVDAAMRQATQLARMPFNIAQESLLRIALYRTGVTEHVLSVCMHHLITDAWSMGILVRDLLTCYDQLVADKPLRLQAPAISYIDYAHWQREFMTGPQFNMQLDYWKQQLKGAEAIELPTDRRRRQQRSSVGELEPLALSGELMESIGALAIAQGVTPFMVMLAAFEVLLFRWTGRTDIVVGVPVANRNWQESEALMGTLVNTLPVRLRFNEHASFLELLHEVRKQALDSYANQDLPFEKLIAELQLERKPGASPLVSVMFDYQNTPMPERSSGAISMKPLFLSRGSAQFDLSLLILDTEFGRIAGVEYSTDLFSAETIKRLLGHYLTLLEAVILSPNLAIDRVPLLRHAEHQALLEQAQRHCHTHVDVWSLVQRIDAQCLSTPTRLAVQDASVALTYAELQQRVQRASACLTLLRVVPGQRVAVCMERGVDLVIALLAVMRCGAAYVPLDPSHPRDRLGYVLEDAQPVLLLTQTHLQDIRQMAGALHVEYLDQLLANATNVVVPPVTCDESLAAYVIYTSGSTGRPKGVEVSRRALANFIQSMQHTPGMISDDRLLSVTTVAFDIAGLELYLPLVTGAAVYVAGNDVAADGERLSKLMQDWQVTFMQATPATWKMLIEAGWRGNSRLKALCGGEAFPPELAEQLLRRAGSVWNMYGPTETTIWSAVHRLSSGTNALIPIGIPIDQTSIYILDKHQQLVPQGVPGEIWIGGLGVANGYYQRPDLNAERFFPDPFMDAEKPQHARMYRTGDAGRLRTDGLLEHLGRLDDQIKIRGFRIEPGEIQQVLKEHPGIQDAVVLAREVRTGDMRLVAYYVPTEREPLTELPVAELLEPLRRRLPAYMIPTAFVALAAFPTTPNNKIDRLALPPPPLDASASDAEYEPPHDELEAALANLWQALLKVQRVGIRDNFFMLGGHSLLAVRLFAQITTQFGVNLPMAMLFERPTIEFLAEAIRQAKQANIGAVSTGVNQSNSVSGLDIASLRYLVPIRRDVSKNPLFCVHGAGGNVLNLWALSRRLGNDQPFYGVQARGVDGLASPMTDVYEMADAYLQEIRLVQPHGPYYLSGYCAGGWVALEMARRLQAAGEQVALLALLDCYHPSLQTESMPLRNLVAGLRKEGLTYLWRRAPESLLRYFTQAATQLRIGIHRVLGRAVPIGLREFWLTSAMTRASVRYRPDRYDGDVALMRAVDMEPQLRVVGTMMGWQEVFIGTVVVTDVAGDHHTLAQEPYVDDLAAQLHAQIVARSQDFGLALRTGMMTVGKPETFR